jgi:hypothetical protein
MRFLGVRGMIAFLFMVCAALLAGQRVSQAAAAGQLIQPNNPVTDLVPGDIKLRWTATGDDNNAGRASAYDIRYLPVSIGPINSEDRWNQAIQLIGEPRPSRSGQIDSMLIHGLTPGCRYYFCLKVIDETGNCSGLSNSPAMTAAGGDFIPGDANNSGGVNGLDIVYLVHYFKGGDPPPEPILRADCNGNCEVNGVDVIFLLCYLHGSNVPPFRGNCNPILAAPKISGDNPNQ